MRTLNDFHIDPSWKVDLSVDWLVLASASEAFLIQQLTVSMGKRRREERVQTIMAKAIEQYQCQRTENISLMSVFKIIHTVCVWMNATYWTYALEKRHEPVNTHLSSSGSIHSSPGGLRVPLKISWRMCTLLNNHNVSLNMVSNRRKLCFLMATYVYNHALGTGCCWWWSAAVVSTSNDTSSDWKFVI